ncbi:MAG: enoyl-CoA hydratase/isomerase family protein [Bacteroidia bacterium]|nr:enoyl-CoA hydratase/isomerase family protein [Bacteroidia bacterium]
MNFETIKTELKGNILIVQINRPDKMNALSMKFMDELSLLTKNIELLPDVKVIVITGNDKIFAAGGDINEMLSMNETEATAASAKVQKTYQNIEELPIPVIAAVNGYALGGGFELALACDFIIASQDAVFGLPEVDLSVIPAGGGTQRLPKITGIHTAKFLLMTGAKITAEEACKLNLVQKIAAPGKAVEEALAIAQNIAAKPKETIKKIKQVLNKSTQSPFEEGCKLESEYFGFLVENEGKKGLKSFLDKKK